MPSQYYAKTRSDWRRWLSAHHKAATEIWLVFFKRHAGKQCVSYDEAVEEALCFGWVDSIVTKIDDYRYAQKFSPRKPTSRWSRSNIARMKKMIAAKKVTAAGYGAYAGHEERIAQPHPTTLPSELELIFRRSTRAWNNFARFPPGYRRMTIGWVASAKRDETQRRRLERVIEASARGERLEFI